MINGKFTYSALTRKIIGAAIGGHEYLGNGFQEVIYQRALSHEMEFQGITHNR
jgi:GxxExxY protein